MRRILIVGSGFAGMYSALCAARLRDEQGVSPDALEIVVERMRREFGVKARVGNPQVAYRETITRRAEGEHKLVRTTVRAGGARGEYGHVQLVVEPTGSETQVFAKLGGEQVVAVFRERHQFNPGDRIRLKPDPTLVHLFDETTGKRLNA